MKPTRLPAVAAARCASATAFLLSLNATSGPFQQLERELSADRSLKYAPKSYPDPDVSPPCRRGASRLVEGMCN